MGGGEAQAPLPPRPPPAGSAKWLEEGGDLQVRGGGACGGVGGAASSAAHAPRVTLQAARSEAAARRGASRVKARTGGAPPSVAPFEGDPCQAMSGGGLVCKSAAGGLLWLWVPALGLAAILNALLQEAATRSSEGPPSE